MVHSVLSDGFATAVLGYEVLIVVSIHGLRGPHVTESTSLEGNEHSSVHLTSLTSVLKDARETPLSRLRTHGGDAASSPHLDVVFLDVFIIPLLLGRDRGCLNCVFVFYSKQKGREIR